MRQKLKNLKKNKLRICRLFCWPVIITFIITFNLSPIPAIAVEPNTTTENLDRLGPTVDALSEPAPTTPPQTTSANDSITSFMVASSTINDVASAPDPQPTEPEIEQPVINLTREELFQQNRDWVEQVEAMAKPALKFVGASYGIDTREITLQFVAISPGESHLLFKGDHFSDLALSPDHPIFLNPAEFFAASVTVINSRMPAPAKPFVLEVGRFPLEVLGGIVSGSKIHLRFSTEIGNVLAGINFRGLPHLPLGGISWSPETVTPERRAQIEIAASRVLSGDYFDIDAIKDVNVRIQDTVTTTDVPISGISTPVDFTFNGKGYTVMLNQTNGLATGKTWDITGLKELTSNPLDLLQKTLDQAVATLKALTDKLTEAVGDALKALLDAIKSVTDTINTVAKTIADLVGGDQQLQLSFANFSIASQQSETKRTVRVKGTLSGWEAGLDKQISLVIQYRSHHPSTKGESAEPWNTITIPKTSIASDGSFDYEPSGYMKGIGIGQYDVRVAAVTSDGKVVAATAVHILQFFGFDPPPNPVPALISEVVVTPSVDSAEFVFNFIDGDPTLTAAGPVTAVVEVKDREGRIVSSGRVKVQTSGEVKVPVTGLVADTAYTYVIRVENKDGEDVKVRLSAIDTNFRTLPVPLVQSFKTLEEALAAIESKRTGREIKEKDITIYSQATLCVDPAPGADLNSGEYGCFPDVFFSIPAKTGGRDYRVTARKAVVKRGDEWVVKKWETQDAPTHLAFLAEGYEELKKDSSFLDLKWQERFGIIYNNVKLTKMEKLPGDGIPQLIEQENFALEYKYDDCPPPGQRGACFGDHTIMAKGSRSRIAGMWFYEVKFQDDVDDPPTEIKTSEGTLTIDREGGKATLAKPNGDKVTYSNLYESPIPPDQNDSDRPEGVEELGSYQNAGGETVHVYGHQIFIDYADPNQPDEITAHHHRVRFLVENDGTISNGLVGVGREWVSINEAIEDVRNNPTNKRLQEVANALLARAGDEEVLKEITEGLGDQKGQAVRKFLDEKKKILDRLTTPVTPSSLLTKLAKKILFLDTTLIHVANLYRITGRLEHTSMGDDVGIYGEVTVADPLNYDGNYDDTDEETYVGLLPDGSKGYLVGAREKEALIQRGIGNEQSVFIKVVSDTRYANVPNVRYFLALSANPNLIQEPRIVDAAPAAILEIHQKSNDRGGALLKTVGDNGKPEVTFSTLLKKEPFINQFVDYPQLAQSDLILRDGRRVMKVTDPIELQWLREHGLTASVYYKTFGAEVGLRLSIDGILHVDAASPHHTVVRYFQDSSEAGPSLQEALAAPQHVVTLSGADQFVFQDVRGRVLRPPDIRPLERKVGVVKINNGEETVHLMPENFFESHGIPIPAYTDFVGQSGEPLVLANGQEIHLVINPAERDIVRAVLGTRLKKNDKVYKRYVLKEFADSNGPAHSGQPFYWEISYFVVPADSASEPDLPEPIQPEPQQQQTTQSTQPQQIQPPQTSYWNRLMISDFRVDTVGTDSFTVSFTVTGLNGNFSYAEAVAAKADESPFVNGQDLSGRTRAACTPSAEGQQCKATLTGLKAKTRYYANPLVYYTAGTDDVFVYRGTGTFVTTIGTPVQQPQPQPTPEPQPQPEPEPQQEQVSFDGLGYNCHGVACPAGTSSRRRFVVQDPATPNRFTLRGVGPKGVDNISNARIERNGSQLVIVAENWRDKSGRTISGVLTLGGNGIVERIQWSDGAVWLNAERSQTLTEQERQAKLRRLVVSERHVQERYALKNKHLQGLQQYANDPVRRRQEEERQRQEWNLLINRQVEESNLADQRFQIETNPNLTEQEKQAKLRRLAVSERHVQERDALKNKHLQGLQQYANDPVRRRQEEERQRQEWNLLINRQVEESNLADQGFQIETNPISGGTGLTQTPVVGGLPQQITANNGSVTTFNWNQGTANLVNRDGNRVDFSNVTITPQGGSLPHGNQVISQVQQGDQTLLVSGHQDMIAMPNGTRRVTLSHHGVEFEIKSNGDITMQVDNKSVTPSDPAIYKRVTDAVNESSFLKKNPDLQLQILADIRKKSTPQQPATSQANDVGGQISAGNTTSTTSGSTDLTSSPPPGSGPQPQPTGQPSNSLQSSGVPVTDPAEIAAIAEKLGVGVGDIETVLTFDILNESEKQKELNKKWLPAKGVVVKLKDGREFVGIKRKSGALILFRNDPKEMQEPSPGSEILRIAAAYLGVPPEDIAAINDKLLMPTVDPVVLRVVVRLKNGKQYAGLFQPKWMTVGPTMAIFEPSSCQGPSCQDKTQPKPPKPQPESEPKQEPIQIQPPLPPQQGLGRDVVFAAEGYVCLGNCASGVEPPSQQRSFVKPDPADPNLLILTNDLSSNDGRYRSTGRFIGPTRIVATNWTVNGRPDGRLLEGTLVLGPPGPDGKRVVIGIMWDNGTEWRIADAGRLIIDPPPPQPQPTKPQSRDVSIISGDYDCNVNCNGSVYVTEGPEGWFTILNEHGQVSAARVSDSDPARIVATAPSWYFNGRPLEGTLVFGPDGRTVVRIDWDNGTGMTRQPSSSSSQQANPVTREKGVYTLCLITPSGIATCQSAKEGEPLIGKYLHVNTNEPGTPGKPVPTPPGTEGKMDRAGDLFANLLGISPEVFPKVWGKTTIAMPDWTSEYEVVFKSKPRGDCKTGNCGKTLAEEKQTEATPDQNQTQTLQNIATDAKTLPFAVFTPPEIPQTDTETTGPKTQSCSGPACNQGKKEPRKIYAKYTVHGQEVVPWTEFPDNGGTTRIRVDPIPIGNKLVAYDEQGNKSYGQKVTDPAVITGLNQNAASAREGQRVSSSANQSNRPNQPATSSLRRLVRGPAANTDDGTFQQALNTQPTEITGPSGARIRTRSQAAARAAG